MGSLPGEEHRVAADALFYKSTDRNTVSQEKQRQVLNSTPLFSQS
jgi:hypothetical protein